MMPTRVGGSLGGYFSTVSPFSAGREAEARLKFDVFALNRKPLTNQTRK